MVQPSMKKAARNKPRPKKPPDPSALLLENYDKMTRAQDHFMSGHWFRDLMARDFAAKNGMCPGYSPNGDKDGAPPGTIRGNWRRSLCDVTYPEDDVVHTEFHWIRLAPYAAPGEVAVKSVTLVAASVNLFDWVNEIVSLKISTPTVLEVSTESPVVVQLQTGSTQDDSKSVECVLAPVAEAPPEAVYVASIARPALRVLKISRAYAPVARFKQVPYRTSTAVRVNGRRAKPPGRLKDVRPKGSFFRWDLES